MRKNKVKDHLTLNIQIRTYIILVKSPAISIQQLKLN